MSKIKCTCPRSRVTFPVKLGKDMHAQSCAKVQGSK